MAEERRFRCMYCRKNYAANKHLLAHVRSSHPGMTAPEKFAAGRKPKKTSEEHACGECNKVFGCKRNLMRHITYVHKARLPTATAAESSVNLRAVKEFNSNIEFLQWKVDEEDLTGSRFVKVSGDARRTHGVVVRKYRCHRSGNYKKEGRGVRNLKVQGSCKIGKRCPADMVARILPNGKVHVSYHSLHQNHENDLAHIRLRSADRQEIARMLSDGLTPEAVLEKMRSKGGHEKMSHYHLITNKDIQNITREFNLSKGIVFHKNDADSVAAWVERNRQEDGANSMIRFVKFQGDDAEDGLRVDDFMLVIMSAAQVAGLRKFGGPMKEVALDSTHGTNAYDFQLTTLLVIDDHGEGFPGAFCYSSRVDEVVVAKYLDVCKRVVGNPLSDVILMTDDAEVFRNAWVKVMGPPRHTLLCTWHVDRAWRRNLKRVSGDRDIKVNVYKTLRALMEIRDSHIFEERLRQFLEAGLCDPKTMAFTKYFEAEYASRSHLWAYSSRLGLRVHHNMHLEALHRVLKHVHLQGRKCRRMDKSIHALLQLMRAKDMDRLLKLNKGKWTKHSLGIMNRHRKSLSMDPSLVTCLEDNDAFTVTGSRNELYFVRRETELPHDESLCAQKCRDCGVCVHAFKCTCLDGGLRNTICKHIHLVVRCFGLVPLQKANDVGDETEVECAEMHDLPQQGLSLVQNNFPDLTDTLEETVAACGTSAPHQSEVTAILGSLQMQPHTSKGGSVANTIHDHWGYISLKVGKNDRIDSTICESLARLRALVDALESRPELPEVSAAVAREPANKKMAPQRSFASTRKKVRCRHDLSMTKPTAAEKEALLDSLSGNVEVISRSLLDTDHDYDARPSEVVHFEHSY